MASTEEYAAVIAGLRALQMVIEGDPVYKVKLDDILNETENPLDSDQIEELIQEIQFGRLTLERKAKKKAVKVKPVKERLS